MKHNFDKLIEQAEHQGWHKEEPIGDEILLQLSKDQYVFTIEPFKDFAYKLDLIFWGEKRRQFSYCLMFDQVDFINEIVKMMFTQMEQSFNQGTFKNR